MSEEMNSEEWQKYEEVMEQFIQVIAKNMSLYGINPSIGRLYGALYFSEEPMTLDDMREAMAMSKTSMSTGVKVLSEMKMVESTYKKGVRKDLYKSEEDWYKSFTSLFGIRWRHNTESNIEEANEALEELKKIKENTTDEALINDIEIKMDKLQYSKNYYEWLMDFIKVVETGEIFKYIPKRD